MPSGAVPTYKVQDCGCISLPEDLQKVTGLYPGASFQFQVAEDGSRVILTSIQRTHPTEPSQGVTCGLQVDR
jgi:hypothetical protein